VWQAFLQTLHLLRWHLQWGLGHFSHHFQLHHLLHFCPLLSLLQMLVFLLSHGRMHSVALSPGLATLSMLDTSTMELFRSGEAEERKCITPTLSHDDFKKLWKLRLNADNRNWSSRSEGHSGEAINRRSDVVVRHFLEQSR
jgi:hypothetical protein